MKGTHALFVYIRFPTTCDPSFSGEAPKKCFLRKYKFSEAEYEQLTEREKGLVKINQTPRVRELRSHNKTYDPEPQSVDYYGYEGVENKTVNFEYDAFLVENNFLKLDAQITQEAKTSSKDTYHYTVYYEVDNTTDFNSILTYRYPNLRPVKLAELENGPSNITNYSGVQLNVLSSSLRNISNETGLNTSVIIPFNHNIFKLETAKNRNELDYNFLNAIAQIFNTNQTQVDTARQISNFLKMNLMWGGDSHQRAPIDTFLSKVVECGHMNSLVGVMFEMTGGRFRYVSGHDPYLRPKKPNAGHALIEIYSKENKSWSILDTYFDIFADNISTSDLATSALNELPVLRTKEDKDGLLTLGELFRHRNYGDSLSRLPVTSMSYIANQEENYGLNWELAKFNKGKSPNLTNEKIYIRARVIATKCPIRYIDNLEKGCFGGAVSYSDWKVKTVDLTKH